MKEADGLRVLLVDDVMDALEPLQMLLTLRGCDVRSASCADAALAIEKVWRPDVVITDIGLPGMDGRQLASQLRELDPHVVIIALSGTPPPSDWNSQQTAMFDHYLVKPLNFTQLEACLVCRERARRTLAASGPRWLASSVRCGNAVCDCRLLGLPHFAAMSSSVRKEIARRRGRAQKEGSARKHGETEPFYAEVKAAPPATEPHKFPQKNPWRRTH